MKVNISRLKKVRLDPGDVVVVECSQRLSQEGIARLRECLHLAWPDNDSMILDSGMKLKVTRHKPQE